MKKAIAVAIVSAFVFLFASSVVAQQARAQTQPESHIVYNMISQLTKVCASSESTFQNRCNGYVYGVIDALDAQGLSCPDHPSPTYFGPRVKEDIAALARKNLDTIPQSAASVIASLLKSYGCQIPLDGYGIAKPDSSQVEAPPGCKDVEAYKEKVPEDDHGYFQIWFNTWACETWADEHGNQKLAHDSFNALNNLYTHESTALETELWPNKNAPAACKAFQDYQRTSHDAMMAGIGAKLAKTEILENVNRSEKDFRAAFIWEDAEGLKTTSDLSACASWAWDSHLTVIALEIVKLKFELFDDTGLFPIGIEKVGAVCTNASAESAAILQFVGQHTGDDRIMPRDVEPYYERATPLSNCMEQIAQTKYRSAYERLLLAVAGINNLMVVAYTNAEMKLIHALPPPQPGSPIVIKVQNSYRQNSNSNHCTGTVLNLGSISSIDWNCN